MLRPPGLLLPGTLSPQQATADPCLCRRPSNTHRQVRISEWGSFLYDRQIESFPNINVDKFIIASQSFLICFKKQRV